MSDFLNATQQEEQTSHANDTTRNTNNRTAQEICTPAYWHSLFTKRLLKTRFLPLETEILDYLLADGLVLPQGTRIHGVSGDQLSDEEDVAETNAATNEAPSFPALTAAIDQAIAELGGKVFVKINWMSAIDAVWVNGGTAVCHTAGDVFLLLKSSDKISSAVETLVQQSEENRARARAMTSQLHNNTNTNTDTANTANHTNAMPTTQPTLCLVKWANFFPSMEFRCFVKNNKLVGLCQRNCSTHFEFLRGEMMDWVQDTVVEVFHSAIKDVFPLPSYVYDIYIDKQKRVWLVDFNTYGDPTKPLLFEWSDFDDHDDADDEHHSNSSSHSNSEGELANGVLVRTVMSSHDLLPHEAGQSRGPTDVIDHKAEVSSVMQLSRAQLQAMRDAATSSSSEEEEEDE